MKNKIRRIWRSVTADIFILGGAASIAVGTGMIFLPAGLIVAGLLAIAAAALLSPGGDNNSV